MFPFISHTPTPGLIQSGQKKKKTLKSVDALSYSFALTNARGRKAYRLEMCSQKLPYLHLPAAGETFSFLKVD